MVTGAADAATSARHEASEWADTESRVAAGTCTVLAAWAGLILLAYVLVERLQAAGANVRIQASPLVGTFELRLSGRLAAAIAIGSLVVFAGPRLSRVAGWRTLLVGTAAASAMWAGSLALVDGWGGLTKPLEARTEYLADVASVGAPGTFLATFVDRIADYGVHTQGHPPGLLLLLSGLDRIGLGGSSWAAVLFISAGAAAVPAVLVAVREIAGEELARRAAPFLVVAPAAIWIASSADALYMGVSAWAVCLVVLATGRCGRRSDAYALIGGLLFGATALLSYGLVLLALVPALVGWRRRRFRPLVLSAVGAAPVFVGFLASGFWWVAGLLATRERYFAGVGSRRPYLDFLVVNAACLAIALGPAVAVGMARLRDRRLWLLVGGTLAAVTAAAISGMSKGEVERIWLPFAIWLLPAGAALTADRDRGSTGWLGLQATVAIVVTTAVKTSW